MKLKNLIPQRYHRLLVRQFGHAKLVKFPNGQHELIGGSHADRAAAFAWTSLFAHEIVFTYFHRDTAPHRPVKARWLNFPISQRLASSIWF